MSTRPKKPMKDKKLYRHLLKESLLRRVKGEAKCAHFGDCGGCELQRFSAVDQLAAKRELLAKLIQHIGVESLFRGIEIESVASPLEYGYRQRMDFVFAFDKAGMRRKNSHREVVPLGECHLIPPAGFATFERARDLAREANLPSYDYLKHEGFIRYFVVRRTRTGETLISIVTKSRDHEDEVAKIAETLIAEGHATSVHRLLSDGMGDVSFGPSIAHFGDAYIRESFFSKTFLVGPNTFFQANASVAEEGYKRIIEYAQAAGHAEMLDLFSGTGVIAVLCADVAEKIIAVDSEPDNHSLARLNLRDNKIENVDFMPEDVMAFLRRYRGSPGMIVVNPPRPGIGEKAIYPLIQRKPEHIAYLSCNPLSLLRDLMILGREYQIERASVLDMFPQTRHFETLICLCRR